MHTKPKRKRTQHDYELWCSTRNGIYRYNAYAYTLNDAKTDARLELGPFKLITWVKTP